MFHPFFFFFLPGLFTSCYTVGCGALPERHSNTRTFSFLHSSYTTAVHSHESYFIPFLGIILCASGQTPYEAKSTWFIIQVLRLHLWFCRILIYFASFPLKYNLRGRHFLFALTRRKIGVQTSECLSDVLVNRQKPEIGLIVAGTSAAAIQTRVCSSFVATWCSSGHICSSSDVKSEFVRIDFYLKKDPPPSFFLIEGVSG